MHGTQHTGNKSVYVPTLLDQGDKSRDATFIVSRMPEMRKYNTLERLDLVLETHKV